MPSLIVFRLVQGIGAGAVQPTAMTIVGDLYSAHERGKIQGWLASVWAISAILGPLAGGLIIQYFSWAWIFWMNLPIGALAAAGFWAFLHEKSARGRGRIDHLSAGIFTVAIAAIMVDLTALSTSGRFEIGLTTLVACGCGRAVRSAGAPLSGADDFARTLGPPADRSRQRRVAPGRHGDDRAHHVSADVRAGRDAALAADRRLRAFRDGARMADRGDGRRARRPQALRRARRAAGRRRADSVGRARLSRPDGESSPIVAGLGSLVIGLGMGLSSSASIILIQEIVDWSERGSVTASYLFARSLGSTFGATVFGAVLNFGLLRSGHAGATSEQLRQLLEQGSEALGEPGCARRLNSRFTSLSCRCSRSRSWSRRPCFWCRRSSSLLGARSPSS